LTIRIIVIEHWCRGFSCLSSSFGDITVKFLGTSTTDGIRNEEEDKRKTDNAND
jgi:hypothetical protein